ncbi:hypothetical protein NFI96_018837, partial [Prochilodus magdalenae]
MWSEYNKKYNDVTPSYRYEDRVEFSNRTYSLTLKNLQKTDSGLYVARAVGDEDTVVAEYRLSVLDPVEAPALTHQIIRDTCYITLTCRGHDLSLNSSCYKDTCEEKEVTSPGGVTLSLSVRGSSIICNHSNPVSWKEDVLEMGELKRLCADGAQLGLVLSVWFSVAGSSDVFGLVGSYVKLDIQPPVSEFRRLSWMFNSTDFVLEFNKRDNKVDLFPHYEDRVEFSNRTYSLTLKNLQKTDSGLYEARASNLKDTVVAVYRLSVLDPVEAPVLTYQVIGDTCNITLTCRGHDLSISSSCYNETCEEKNETSPGGVTLSLSVRGSSIICNQSNPVSWKNKTLEMGELKRHCADGGEDKPIPIGWLWPVVGILVGIVLIVISIICFKIRQRKSA